MKYEYTYTVNIERDKDRGGYVATIPALPGCAACGETFEDAIVMAKGVIEGYIQVLSARGWQIPYEAQPIPPLSLSICVEAAA